VKFILLVAALAYASKAQEARSGEELKNPLAGQRAAIEAGTARFRDACAACHGANAEGGRGPKLVQNRDLYRLTDGALFNIIKRGIPGTSMPPFQFPDDQTWQLVTFVRSLSSPASQAGVEGDAEHGRELFYGAGGCNACHSIRGKGGLIAPDLTNSGGTLTAPELRESIEKPSERITAGFEAVDVHLKGGRDLQGVAKNESTYSLQLLDKSGKLHLLNRSEIASIARSQKSLMPDDVAQRLGPDGVKDVIAFLAQQVVRPGATQVQRRGRGRDVQ
jgi:cytochrome c oxidase cbb3-type subunit III